MASSPVFISDRSQAVRLPKAVALADDVAQVDVVQISHNRMVVPRGGTWDDPLLDGLRVSEDFLAEREQPAAEMREPL